MEVNRINCVCSKVNFKAGFAENSEKKQASKDASAKIKNSLICLAVLSSVAIGAAILKKKNILPPKFQVPTQEEILMEKLNGERDAHAVKIYKSYRAQQKSESLSRKMIDGEFYGKPDKVYDYLVRNQKKLRRETIVTS